MHPIHRVELRPFLRIEADGNPKRVFAVEAWGTLPNLSDLRRFMECLDWEKPLDVAVFLDGSTEPTYFL